MRSRRTGVAILALGASLIALLPLSATALATTRYAAPDGGATAGSCTSGFCTLEYALAVAEPEDDVELAPGSYEPESTPLVPGRNVEIHGESRSDRSTIEVSEGLAISLEEASMADLDVVRTGEAHTQPVVRIALGTAERIRVTATEGYACSLGGGNLRNSVCEARQASYAALHMTTGPHFENYASVVGSTLYNGDEGGFGVVVDAGGGETNNLTLVNSIARGGGADIRAVANHSGAVVKVSVLYSNYDPDDVAEEASGGGSANVEDGFDNAQADPPEFVDADAGDLRQQAGSPTVDAGIDEFPGTGDYDVVGDPRKRGAAIDIGAYEHEPVEEGHEREVGSGGEEEAGEGVTTPKPPGPASGPVPRLLGLRVAPNVVLLGKRRRPALVAFRLSEPARVVMLVQRPRLGVRVRVRGKGLRCARPSRRTRRLLRRRARRCVRWSRVGVLRRPGHRGLNRLRLNGRIGKRFLRPGRYRLVVLAVDSDRQRPGKPLVRGFRVRVVGRRAARR